MPNESSGFCNTKTAEPRIARVDQEQDELIRLRREALEAMNPNRIQDAPMAHLPILVIRLLPSSNYKHRQRRASELYPKNHSS